ncbi:response regulator of RpoS [Shigella dysenteriae]|uniref:Response regulator of RpoS n=1 Tax=Shigella dysenteriae TaxID=622 RepID=A0A2X2IHK7_SHIDY|nr:response regulator of RpoS [Shigella dysenteriae]
MNGLKLLEHIRNRGDQTPVLVISATENGRYAKALRLGVEDVLLKPVKDLNRLREMVFACLYPSMFNSRVEEEEGFFATGMQWLITLPRRNYYRNYNRRFSR